MKSVYVTRGMSPVILGLPHAGVSVPPAIWERLNDNGRLLADTDWHLRTLYDRLGSTRASTVQATFHRYVIDANRDPAGTSLYPGQNTTALVPTTDFDGKAIWCDGKEPTPEEVSARLARFHAPYHAAMAAEIQRVKDVHGVAVLYDCHSIRSRIPFLFEGRLPDFNVGTNDGLSCAPAIERMVVECVRAADDFTSVLNGRFKGGWTTRHYGHPQDGVHAVQVEIAQSTYLRSETPPFTYDAAKAGRIRERLRIILEAVEAVALSREARKDQP